MRCVVARGCLCFSVPDPRWSNPRSCACRAPLIMRVPAISKRQLACSHGTDPHRCRPGQLRPEKTSQLSPRQGYHWVDCAASCGIPLRQSEGMPQLNGLPPCLPPPAPRASMPLLPLFPPLRFRHQCSRAPSTALPAFVPYPPPGIPAPAFCGQR